MRKIIYIVSVFFFSLPGFAQQVKEKEGTKNDTLFNKAATVNEIFLGDDDSEQEISSTVLISNDIYLSQSRFQLSQFRFRVRGYEPRYEQRFINGVRFNDQNRGVFNYASIGALNDLTRNGDVVNFMNPGAFSFGTIGGSENINMRAGSYAKGTKATLSYTNRIYYSRAMITHASGLRDDGWAFVGGIGGRYSHEGNVQGTFYNNFSYALGVEKQFDNGKHSLSFITFGSPVQRGQQGGSFQEVYDLVGDNLYNPNWGYQNGEKRNARVVTAFDPTVVLSHIWKINPKMTLSSGVGGHYQRYGTTSLNWYNGPDPRPDYYRYLPSYYTASPEVAGFYTKLWQQTCGDTPFSQINWNNLYAVNALAAKQGLGAVYMVEERRNDLYELTANSTLNTYLNDNLNINAGVEFRHTTSKQFKTVKDLLGANYLVDVDKYAERDFPDKPDLVQNDLTRPGRKVYEGDIFGYDFNLHINSATAWVQNIHKTTYFDFYYGSKLSYTQFQREGDMKNGRYPENSYGKGDNHTFVDFGFKTGGVYKISGRHILTLNSLYQTDAPLPYSAYVSPTISDITNADLKSGRMFSADLSYIASLPSVMGRVSLFYTRFYDQLKRVSYYHDLLRTFVNHVMTGVEMTNQGIEVGVKWKYDNHWTFDFAGTHAEYFYNNNPKGVISVENGSKPDMAETVYLKNLHVGNTPQTAATLGINYFYKFWFFNLNVNGITRNYIDIAPIRRLSSNYTAINPADPKAMEAYNKLVEQEQYAGAVTLDFSIGKILYLKNRNAVNFNLSFFNITNNKNIKTGGYEQGRIDITAPDKFPSKYYYMQGFNCFLNASYRF